MIVTVRDLRSDLKITYVGISPKMAVVCAYETFDRHNYNDWTYDFSKARVSKSGKTVSCGDFCALMEQENENNSICN